MNSLQQSLFTALQACHAALQNLHVRQHWDKHIEDLLGDDMYDEAVDAENLAAAALADSRLRTEPSSDTGLFSGVIPSGAKDLTPAQQAALDTNLPEDQPTTRTEQLSNDLIAVIWPYLDQATDADDAKGDVKDAVDNALDAWEPAPPEDDRTPTSVGPDAPADRRQDGQHAFADCGGDEDDAFVGGQECTFRVADAPPAQPWDVTVAALLADGRWNEHPDSDLSRMAWRQEVADGNVQSGYWDWLRNCLEQRAESEEAK